MFQKTDLYLIEQVSIWVFKVNDIIDFIIVCHMCSSCQMKLCDSFLNQFVYFHIYLQGCIA